MPVRLFYFEKSYWSLLKGIFGICDRKASSFQRRGTSLGSAEKGLGSASGPRWKRNSSCSLDPGAERGRSWSQSVGTVCPGEQKAEFDSILRGSAEMLSICKNLDWNVYECPLKTAFYKLRLRQEGRIGLEDPLGWSGSHVQFAFLLHSFNSRHSL